MGHEVENLHPVEGQTYLRAVEELSARREALLLGKRRLTKMDQEIMRWRTWSLRRILDWWRMEAARHIGRMGRKRGRSRGGDDGKRQRRLTGMGAAHSDRPPSQVGGAEVNGQGGGGDVRGETGTAEGCDGGLRKRGRGGVGQIRVSRAAKKRKTIQVTLTQWLKPAAAAQGHTTRG